MIGVSVKSDRVNNLGQKFAHAQRKRLEDAMGKGHAFSLEVAPEDRGQLRQSIFNPEWRDGQLVFGTPAAQAPSMEFGTDPYYPPLEPLLEWSERVTGDKGLGYYVALEKIPTEGISAQPYLRPGSNVAKQYLKSNSLGDYLQREF